MAYSQTNSKGATYYLHANERTKKNGDVFYLYYFSKEINDAKAVDALPEGREVVELETGMFVLKKTK